MEYEKIPKRARRVIEQCREGELLCRYIRRGAEETETRFAYEMHPSSRVVGVKSARQAIESGFLVPQGDGLFGDDTSQTWRASISPKQEA